MKYVDEFRDGERARALQCALREAVREGRRYRFMEFCGGHTHAVFRYGVPDLLPAEIELIHGPGCPVCVLPVGRLDMAIRLARENPEVILCSYGDMLRVPGSGGESLFRARAEGADVRMVYSVTDALALARAHPERQIVFFAIGFETTTPPTALALLTAEREGLGNFSVFCNHVLTPAAMRAILSVDPASGERVEIDGFIGPSHVSIVIGASAYRFCAAQYEKTGSYRRFRTPGRTAGTADAGASGECRPRGYRKPVPAGCQPRGQPQGPGGDGAGIHPSRQL